jgi:outer membrane protein assembly factor BamB
MKLKGDLDSIGLSELFKTLSDQRATGILSVTSVMGEKFIAIKQGAISVFSDKINERSRLGDLLVVRGHLTENQLLETLKTQRANDPRTKLGDLLLKKGIITEDRIADALRFQMEEEIYDLFTWKGAVFEFDSEKSAEDVSRGIDERNSYHLLIDPQTLIAEATRRMPEWKKIESRLPTPYLCFKVTPKGEEALARAARSPQALIKLIREGRTLETTVKRSCMGRFDVCQSVIQMLDDGWVAPFPRADLPMLASDHWAQKRYSDALNIYRGLHDAAEDDAERAKLQAQIDYAIDAIIRARDAGESIEGSEVVSYKAAAEKFKRRQRQRQIALVVFGALSVALTGVLLVLRMAPQPGRSAEYTAELAASGKLVSENKFEEAMDRWSQFYQTLSDKESITAQSVREKIKSLGTKLDSHVEGLLFQVEALERAGKLDEAENACRQIIEQHGKSKERLIAEKVGQRSAQAFASIVKTRADNKAKAELAAVEFRMKEARALLEEKKHLAAKSKFNEVLAAAPAGSTVRQDAENALKIIAGQELECQKLHESAREEARTRAEKALAVFDLLIEKFHDMPQTQKAVDEAAGLRRRLTEARAMLLRADQAEKQRDVVTALDILRKVELDFAEFELTAPLKDRIAKLADVVAELDRHLADASSAALTDKPRARVLFAELMRNQMPYLVSRKAEVPVSVKSSPVASVKVDGKVLGQTPLEIPLPVHRPFKIVIEAAGYQCESRDIDRLLAVDLEIQARLNREPVRLIELKSGIFAPPKVIDGVLYILHGTSLSAFDPSGEKKLWSIGNLFDDKPDQRPASSGTGIELVKDKTWWYPRAAPVAFSAESILLTLRSRQLVEVNLATRAVKPIMTLPVEPVGEPCIERSPLLAGRHMLAVAGGDGKVRACALAKPSEIVWEKALDPASPVPKGGLAAGLRASSDVACGALSASGKLVFFDMLDGRERTLDLGEPMTAFNTLAGGPQDVFAAAVHVNGTLTLVDMKQRAKVWELRAKRGLDEAAFAAADAQAVYSVTRDGKVRKYPAERQQAAPEPLWTRTLDGPPVLPLALGPRAIYCATSFGKVYALNPQDGSVLWDYRPEKKPTQISVYGQYVYLATEDGRVLILNAE